MISELYGTQSNLSCVLLTLLPRLNQLKSNMFLAVPNSTFQSHPALLIHGLSVTWTIYKLYIVLYYKLITLFRRFESPTSAVHAMMLQDLKGLSSVGRKYTKIHKNISTLYLGLIDGIGAWIDSPYCSEFSSLHQQVIFPSARVFAARGKCLCCRPSQSDQFCSLGRF